MARPAHPPAQADDGLDRTDWQPQDLEPTLPGPYECATAGMYIYMRTWTGVTWLSPITGIPTKVRMAWRGIKPGSVPVEKFPSAVRDDLTASLEALRIKRAADLIERGHEQYAKEGKVAQSDVHAAAIGALYS